MWSACDLHEISMQFQYDLHAENRMEIVLKLHGDCMDISWRSHLRQSPYDLLAICMRSSCDLHASFMWSSSDLHAISNGSPGDFHRYSRWWLHMKKFLMSVINRLSRTPFCTCFIINANPENRIWRLIQRSSDRHALQSSHWQLRHIPKAAELWNLRIFTEERLQSLVARNRTKIHMKKKRQMEYIKYRSRTINLSTHNAQ